MAENTENVRFWTKTCGCGKPAIHYSSDFNARVCQNCGVIVSSDFDVENSGGKPFVHLRVHTHLSLLKSTCKASDLIEKAKEWGMTSLAKTEFGNMCGVPTFIKDCVDADIKPIVGTEFNVRFHESVVWPVTFIALDNVGYKNLVRLNTVAWCERQTKEDGIFIDIADVQPEGLVALHEFFTPQDPTETDIQTHKFMLDALKQRVETFIEITKDSQLIADGVERLAKETGLKIVVTGDVLYTNEEDVRGYELALQIGKHRPTRPYYDNWFKPPDRFSTLFGFSDEWIDNAYDIAERVGDYGVINKDFIVPTYKEAGKTYADPDEVHQKLEMAAWSGLYNKGLAENQEYVDRMTFELGVMKEKKFSSYFLIISEIIDYMKATDKLKPIGRGSSVGSLVCYALDIISMDPIKWGVPFERFINDGRIDLPDIDTDITQEGRGDVLRHIASVHGHDRVAQIATFQTMALKAAIDNVGRALQVPHVLNREIRKEIYDDMTEIEEIPASVKKEMAYKPEWIQAAEALLGSAKNLGYHAAGVVISNDQLHEMVPLIPPEDEGGLLGIQYDMRDCEILGLLKLDMLGLTTLDIIQHTLKRIEERHGIEAVPDIYNLPPDDKETFDFIASAEYVSIFQLDSTGYRRLCRQLSPENFQHIMALNALFRPGPLVGGMTAEYVERRHGRKELVGWHPWLDETLSITYQVPVFQEQVMAIAKTIAGFNDVEADKYRKAIGKKNKVQFDAAQEKFKERALKRDGLSPPPGYTGSLESWITELLDKLAGYARYGWNLGHSAGYGWITYITAYLEARFPHEYYASLLDSTDKKQKVAGLIRGILFRKFDVVPPNVNESKNKYEVGSDNKIYMGLSAIRGVGKSADKIIEERDTRGKFKSFVEFCQRMPSINKTVKVNLVKAGAFSWDKMMCDRDKVDNVDIITKIAKKRNKKFDGSKVSPFEIAMQCHINGFEYTDIQKHQNEKDVLNSFITGHPAAVYQKLSPYLERSNVKVICPADVNNDDVCAIGDTVVLIGMVDMIKRKTIQNGRNKGNPYITINISDNEAFISTNVWYPQCDDIQATIAEGQIAMFECLVKKDKFREDFKSLQIKEAISLAHGMPVQGVLCSNGANPQDIVESIGGMLDSVTLVGNSKYASIRGGRITVMPDILDQTIDKFSSDFKFMISMEAQAQNG